LKRGAGTSLQGLHCTAQTRYSESCTDSRSLSFKRCANFRLLAIDSHLSHLFPARRSSHRGCSHSAALSYRSASEDSCISRPAAPDADPIHRAQLLLCVFSFVFYSAAMLVLRFPHAIVLGILGGLLEFIPVLGSWADRIRAQEIRRCGALIWRGGHALCPIPFRARRHVLEGCSALQGDERSHSAGQSCRGPPERISVQRLGQ
jgi:hypothetical protein